MSPRTNKPVDIYVRVSQVGGRGGDSFISPKEQEARCRALAMARGYTVGQVFIDLNQSGGTMDRPEFIKALDRIRAGTTGGILVARLDRFSRTLPGALQTLGEIAEAGGVVVAADGDYDDSTAMGRFARDLMLSLNQLYRDQTAEGWAVTHANHIGRGVHSGNAPAGYGKGEDKKLVPNGYAVQIREAFRLRAEGANWAEVARYLNDADVKITRKGAYRETNWTAGSARKLIGNRAYLGEARFGDLVNKDAHEALVDERTYRLANRKEKRVGGERGDGKLLGGGLCRCGSCGAGLVYAGGTEKQPYAFLRCQMAGTGHATIGVSVIEPYLIAQAWERFAGLKVNMTEALDAVEDPDALANLEAAEADLTELDRALNTREISPAAYAVARSAAERDRDEAAAALVPAGAPDWYSLTEEDYRPALFDAPEGADTEDLSQYTVAADVVAARRFLKEVLSTVTVRTGRGPVEERVQIEN